MLNQTRNVSKEAAEAVLAAVAEAGYVPIAALVDHLAEHGHTRIAMVSGKRGLATTEERVRGFRRGMLRTD